MNTVMKLVKRPNGVPTKDTWEFETTEIPKAAEGTFVVKQIYVSLDPAMRGWMNDAKSYIAPIALGDVMRAGSVGKVIDSQHPRFKVGDYVVGTGGVQKYAQTNGKGWVKVDPSIAPLPLYLSVLGMTGYTAYFGLLDIGTPKEGETILVSGAAGAVGSVVGQIGKIKGCRVVGIAGGPKKCDYIVNELGFDAAIDYKNENVRLGVKQHCPNGIDVYFDNVGGEILDIALTRINKKARIIICGAISQYNNTTPVKGPSNYLSLLVNHARMEGFVIMDYFKQIPQAAMEMGGWYMQGKLKSKEFIVDGIENFYDTFLRLFSGDKMGKVLLKVNEDE